MSNAKQIKTIAYFVGILASSLTIVVGVLNMDTFTLGVMGFLVWAVSPYLYGMILPKLLSKRKAIIVSVLLISVIATAGIFLLIDTMYIHPDAQSALAFVVIAAYQWGLLLLATIPIYVINKKGRG